MISFEIIFVILEVGVIIITIIGFAMACTGFWTNKIYETILERRSEYEQFKSKLIMGEHTRETTLNMKFKDLQFQIEAELKNMNNNIEKINIYIDDNKKTLKRLTAHPIHYIDGN
jgi:tRNA threonylcarbamoyladenosine modification (KEOPS) complex  Pcc1 subunit